MNNNDRFYLRDEHGVTEEYMIVGKNSYIKTQKDFNKPMSGICGIISSGALLGILYYACKVFELF